MSQIKEAFNESLLELEEGKFKDLLTAGLVGGSLLMGNPSAADAKTNFNAIKGDHQVTSKYEHGGKNNSAVSKDNYGGYSYGKNQLSTERRNKKPSTFDFFMKFLRDHEPGLAMVLELAGGWEAAYKGGDDFVDTWKNLSKNPAFNRVYDNFILHTQVLPTYRAMDATKNKSLDKVTTWASTNPAVQAAIESCIIQHGPAGARRLFKQVMDIYKPKTDGAFIHELYKHRAKVYGKLKGAKDRYSNEVKDVKDYHKLMTGRAALPREEKNYPEPKLVRVPDIREQLARLQAKAKAKTKGMQRTGSKR